MTSPTCTDETTYPQNKLTEDEKSQAYKLEKQSWIDAKAFDRVLKNYKSLIKHHLIINLIKMEDG